MGTFRYSRPLDLRPVTTGGRRNLPSRWDLVLFVGLIILLIFGPLAFGAVENWSIATLEAGSAVLVCIGIAKWLLSGSSLLIRNQLYPPLAVLAGIVLIQLVFNLSAYRYATLDYALQALSYYFVFWVSVQVFQSRDNVHKFGTVMSLFGALLALFAISQGLASADKIYGIRTPRYGGWIYGPYVNHNHYAGLMEMLTPFALLRALRQSLRNEMRALWGFAALLMVTSIFLSGSRSGMISVIIEIVLIIGIFFALNRNRRQMITAGGALVLFLGFLFWLGSEQLARRVETLGHPLISYSDRLQMAKDSWQMFKDRPVLGWGLGTFTIIYPHYSTFYSDDIVNAAHDDYIQFLAETGIAGFAAILWFLVNVFRAGVRNLRIWADRRASGVRVAAFLGVIGIVIHSFTDFNLQVPANAAMFFALCALVTTESTK